MKKLTLGIITGIGIAMAAICFICAIVLMNPRFEEDLRANANTGMLIDTSLQGVTTQDDNKTQTTETQIDETQSTESEIETQLPESETEIIQETESEQTKEPTPVVPAVTDHPYYIKVNRTTCCITVYKKDADGNYTIPIKSMACSVGRNGRTPRGKFQTLEKYVWRELNGGVYGQYSTRIVGGVLFHSVPYYSMNKNNLVTSYYNQLGSPASAGCIRLTCADAKWIYDNCAIGVTVEIFDGDDTADPLGKPSTLMLDEGSLYAGWDPTDPDVNNPWKTVKPVISGASDKTIERDATGTYTAEVSAKDSWGNTLSVSVSGTVNMAKCGKYTLTYSATDCIGNKASQKVTVTVVDTTAPVISQSGAIVVTDDTADVEALISRNLLITDNGETVKAAELTFDLSNLVEAMQTKSYGDVISTVYVTDEAGNASAVCDVTLSYIKVESEDGSENDTIPETEPDGEI